MALLVLAKALDVLTRGPQRWPLWLTGLLLAVVGSASLIGGRRSRTGWTAVLLACGCWALDLPLDLRRQHLVLLAGVALAALVGRGADERLLLWRTQLTALYAFAALAKCNETFLGGDVLARAVVAAPAWSATLPVPAPWLLVAAGIGLIATEATLAVTPWIPVLRTPGTLLAVVLHGGALLLVTDSPAVGLRLVVFGGLAVLLHAVNAGRPARLSLTRTAPA